MRRCMTRPAWLAGVLLLLLQSACQSTARRGAFTEPLRHWPPPPAPARIALVGEVRDPTDFGIRPGVWSRVVNTVAGSRRGREPLVQPQGLAVDELGNLCIADPGAGAVIFLDRARDRRLRWTGVGDRPFMMPVAVAKRGNLLLVADGGWGRVVAFDLDGRQRFLTGDEVKQPVALALAGETLWVADAAQHTLFRYDLDGRLLGRVGRRGEGNGEFNFPTHLCAAPDGRIFVTDSMNHRVQILDSNGGYLGSFGQKGQGMGQFSRPKGVAVDSEARVYVVDALFDNVQIFDDTGRLLLYFGEAGSEAGAFWLPAGAAMFGNRLYVADSFNHRVQVFQTLVVP